MVWNISYEFPYIGNNKLNLSNFHIFQRCRAQPPTSSLCIAFSGPLKNPHETPAALSFRFALLKSMGDLQDPNVEVPTIYKAYCSGLCNGISPQNMAKKYGTNVPPSVGSWNSH